MAGRSYGWFWLAAVVAGCASPSEPGSQGFTRVVASPTASDTILAKPSQALVVEVRDPDGALAPGVAVRFTGARITVPPSSEPGMFVAPLASDRFDGFAAAQSDGQGRAAVVVQFGVYAGPVAIDISVPEFGTTLRADFTVRPGGPASVLLLPKDTTLGANGNFQLRATVRDRAGNRRDDPISYRAAATPAGAITLSATGQVSAAGPFGRIAVTAAFGQLSDSAFVSVVPSGSYIAYDAFRGRFVALNLDGSQRAEIPTGYLPPTELEPALSPDGTEIAFSYQNSISLTTLEGEVRPLFPTRPDRLGPAYWPTFSSDGQFVYFSGGTVGVGTNVWRARRDGTGAEPITNGGFDARPSLDPTGRRLTYHSASETGTIVVRVFDIDQRQQTGADVTGLFPEWSPRGDLIAFTNNDNELRVMHPDGTGVRQLAAGPFSPQPLSWSPNGDWILLVANGVTLVHVATGVVVPLGTSNLSYPIWRTAP